MRRIGSLDNYLLKTPEREVRSKFGELLKDYIAKKQKDPNWVVPYIPGTRKAWKTKREKDMRRNNVDWKPPEIRYKDFTEWEFDRYDPNAPLRPEFVPRVNTVKTDVENLLSRATVDEKGSQFPIGSTLNEITEGLSKQLEEMAVPEKKGAKKPTKTVENKFMKKFKDRISKIEDK